MPATWSTNNFTKSQELQQRLYLQMQRKMSKWNRKERTSSPPAERDMHGRSLVTGAFPWETRITPPQIVVEEARQRREAERLKREALLSPEQKAALEAAKAAKAERERLAAVERAEKEAIRRAEQEAAEKVRAAAAAKAREIEEAGEEAAERAIDERPRKLKELIEWRGEVETGKRAIDAEHERILTLAYEKREDVLRRKLGDAILENGVHVAELLCQWDPKETDALGEADFKAAVRSTLPALSDPKVASDALLDEIFLMLDEMGTGLIFDLRREMLRSLRKMVTFAESEQLKQASLKRRSELCGRRIELLNECADAAEKWEGAEAEAKEAKSDAEAQARASDAAEASKASEMAALEEAANAAAEAKDEALTVVMAKAKSLQVTYAREVACTEKLIEIETRPSRARKLSTELAEDSRRSSAEQ